MAMIDKAQSLGNYTGQQGAVNAVYASKAELPPLTLTSALSRAEGLNERVQHVISRLGNIAGALGTLHSVSGDAQANPVPAGVVHRLNNAANDGHSLMSEVEELLSGIERALG